MDDGILKVLLSYLSVVMWTMPLRARLNRTRKHHGYQHSNRQNPHLRSDAFLSNPWKKNHKLLSTPNRDISTVWSLDNYPFNYHPFRGWKWDFVGGFIFLLVTRKQTHRMLYGWLGGVLGKRLKGRRTSKRARSADDDDCVVYRAWWFGARAAGVPLCRWLYYVWKASRAVHASGLPTNHSILRVKRRRFMFHCLFVFILEFPRRIAGSILLSCENT